jgi:hypothetical protein
MNFTRDAIEKHGFVEVGELLQTERAQPPRKEAEPFSPVLIKTGRELQIAGAAWKFRPVNLSCC